MAQSANRIFISELKNHLDSEVHIAGWVKTKRDHGKVLFLDIQDSTGKIQAVTTANQDFFVTAQQTKEQSAIRVSGTVVKRPEKLITQELNGDIELQITKYTVVTEAKDFPWGNESSDNVNEELRMKYRYLDMRNDRVRSNLKLRSEVVHFIRNYLYEKGFTEVETPYITKGTPEGAREFLIPARQHPGQFYALPQSPQQFKQLLMVGGLDRYYQIARCFRDEDPRGDRQQEFTQLDIEMSFTIQDEVLDLIETLMIELVAKTAPEKKIQTKPFPRLTYAEVMKKYNSDKPDLRENKEDPNELAFCWVVDQPMFEYSDTEKKPVAVHHLFTRPKAGEEQKLESNDQSTIMSTLADSYDLVLNGYEVGGGSIRIHEHDLQKRIFEILQISESDVQQRFGHMLEAFQYGVPPHGGIAPGVDRLVMLLAGEPNIREVIAFPKTGDGRDLMMDAPSYADPKQLKELHITPNERKTE